MSQSIQVGPKVTIPLIQQKKLNHERITMLTAYDYPTARMLDESSTDIVLVGDSLAMVVLGYENTLPVGMDEMLYHTKAVSRACRRTLVVGDMPFGSYQGGISQAVENGIRFVKEGGCAAVKLEGGKQRAGIIAALVQAEIPVIGHVGMTPQSMHRFGGFKVQGRSAEAALSVMEDAWAVQEAGAFAVVLESIPVQVASEITARLRIPTIGIGAGVKCDGQVLVLHDLLGMTQGHLPRFVKQYAHLHSLMLNAVNEYCREVIAGQFPDDGHSYGMPDADLFLERVEERYGNREANPSYEGSFEKSKI